MTLASMVAGLWDSLFLMGVIDDRQSLTTTLCTTVWMLFLCYGVVFVLLYVYPLSKVALVPVACRGFLLTLRKSLRIPPVQQVDDSGSELL